MAVSVSGHLGPSRGKIGNIVFYMLNGQQVSRTIGKPGKPSKAQLANRRAMKVIMKLLKPLQGFIKPGFELKARGTVYNAFNLAVSHNKKHALQGQYPDIRVDYSKVLLSSGELLCAEKTSMVKTENGIKLKWTDAKQDLNHHQQVYDDDIVMVALYFPSGDYCPCYLNAARRADGKCLISLPEYMLDQPIEAYMCFKSADGERISNSVYLGNLNGSIEDQVETERKEEEKQDYETIKVRFEKVKEVYMNMKDDGTGLSRKAFKIVAREYEVLQSKLSNHPGKPG